MVNRTHPDILDAARKNTYATELYFQRSKTSEQVFAAVWYNISISLP